MTSVFRRIRSATRRLSVRISLDVLLVIVIPMVVVILALGYKLRANIRDITLSKVEERLKIKADMAVGNINFVKDNVTFLATHLEDHLSLLPDKGKGLAGGIPARGWYRGAKFKNFEDDFRMLLLMNKGYTKVRMINMSGIETIRFERTGSGVREVPYGELEDKSARDYFRNAMASPARQVYLHPVTLEEDRGEKRVPYTPVMRLCRKITPNGGDPVGILGLTILPTTVFGPEDNPGEPGLLVIDQDGNYLRHRDLSKLYGGQYGGKGGVFGELPQLKANLAKQDAMTYFDGERGEFRVWRKVFYQEGDRTRFWVFMERHEEFSILSEYMYLLVQNSIILVISVFAGFTFLLVILYRALSPMRDVTDAIRKLEGGDLSVRAPVVAENEIGEIANAFNSMAERLRETSLELQRSMALAQSVSDIAPMAHIITNSAGTVIAVNPAAKDMFGYAARELLGQNVRMLAPSLKGDEYSKYIKDYFDFKKSGMQDKRKMIRTPKEMLAVRKNGELFYVTLYVKETLVDGEEVFVGIIEDVTDRKKAETALKEGAERNEAIMNATSETLALIGREGNIITINETGAKRFDKKPSDLIGKSIFDVLPFELALARMARFEETIGTRAPIRWEDKRGGMWMANSVYPVFDQKGDVVQFALFAEDITERKAMEEAIREKGARMQAILASAPNGIITIDKRGIIESFNSAAENIFGYGAAETIGKNVKMLMPEPHRGGHDGYLEKYLAGGERKVVGKWREVEGMRKGGAPFPADLFVTEIKLGDDRKFLGVVRDITERKLAEDALKKSGESLARAQHIARLGSWELELPTYKVTWSDETFRLLGFQPGEIGPSFDAFMNAVHPDDKKAVTENLDRIWDEGTLPVLEHRVIGNDGAERVLRTQGEVVRDGAGMPVRVVGTALDVTELKKLEKMKDDFFHAVAHDLKSPITGIKLELEMLGNQIGKFSTECLAKDSCRDLFSNYDHLMKNKISDIGEGLDQLYLMIQSLLKLGEMEEKKLELHYEVFSLGEFLGEMEKDFKARLAMRGAFMEIRNDMREIVISDSMVLKRVLRNLIDNALKYGQPEKGIVLEAVGGEGKDGAKNVIISVSNRGTPLAGDAVNSLFRKFRTTDQRGEGSGIGLYFCYNAMNVLGGAIAVDQEGDVITFHVIFPNG